MTPAIQAMIASLVDSQLRRGQQHRMQHRDPETCIAPLS